MKKFKVYSKLRQKLFEIKFKNWYQSKTNEHLKLKEYFGDNNKTPFYETLSNTI